MSIRVQPEVGKTYDINHSRKGKFRARITAINSYMVECEIVAGKAKMLCEWNEDVAEGESLTMRTSFCAFTEVPS